MEPVRYLSDGGNVSLVLQSALNELLPGNANKWPTFNLHLTYRFVPRLAVESIGKLISLLSA
jgi:hypothetical protein